MTSAQLREDHAGELYILAFKRHDIQAIPHHPAQQAAAPPTLRRRSSRPRAAQDDEEREDLRRVTLAESISYDAEKNLYVASARGCRRTWSRTTATWP